MTNKMITKRSTVYVLNLYTQIKYKSITIYKNKNSEVLKP